MWTVDTQQTADFLTAMVRIDSVNPGLTTGGAGEAEIARWLVRTCESLGLEVQMQETAPGRPNVIAHWPGRGGGKSLLLTGHTDIVSVENMSGDPFDARIEDGRLYGRGAIDMKGGLAAILGAVAALHNGDFQPEGDLWLGFVTDEEYLSIGTTALVQAIRPDAAILTEPTDLNIRIAHKGFAWLTLTLTTQGKAAHGSRYDEGVDAITHMGRLLDELEQMETEIFPQRQHQLLGRASVHASTINGGLGLSTYPDQCRLQIEHRLLPNETARQVITLWEGVIEKLVASDPQFSASVVLDVERPGYEIERDAPIVEVLDTAYRKINQKEPIYEGMSAWLDAAILKQAGIPTVIFGPTGAGAHAAEEYVVLDSVYQCAAVLAEASAQWVGSAQVGP